MWEGQRTPNINGEKRFLRGGSDGDQLKTQEDSLQQHTHGVSDDGHTHGYDDKYPIYHPNDGHASGKWGPKAANKDNDQFDKSHPSTTKSATSNIEVTNVSGARTSGETRPKNIRVVYIIKVF